MINQQTQEEKEFEDMKSLFIRFCCSSFVILMLVSMLSLFGTIESTYVIKKCEVIDIDNDIVTVIDKRNNEWKFYIEEDSDIVVGDNVDLIIDNNHTDHTIIDDEVKRVK